ncbi:MAG: L,D-transpeptidase [Gammaproteobacteria bacterium]|nr:L,D-transpeptidase [Gammaproteobacteria bacterium]
MDYAIEVSISKQQLLVLQKGLPIKKYTVSTAKNGPGEVSGSECTPRGKHIIRAKIGAGCAPDTVFRGRRPTGEIYSFELKRNNPDRDWILTRIMWLSGLEPGKNRLGNVDTMRRYVYIHGCPDDDVMGVPTSHGCIKMQNKDVIELFDMVPVYTPVTIYE